MAEPVRAYSCSVIGWDGETIVNASSRGRAKVEYWRNVTDARPDVPFTAVRCRVAGPPHSSEAFLRTAAYRGLPDVWCGDTVVFTDGTEGVVVGSNSSANFDVEVDGRIGNYHPAYIVEVRHG